MDGAVGKPSFRVSFLGKGDIFLNGARLVFPYRKVQLLLFALLEGCERDRRRLCESLWGKDPTATANLRNALSALKRLLPEGCLAVGRRGGTIALAEGVSVCSDLNELSVERMDVNNVARLSRPFLEDEDSEKSGGEWLEERRAHYSEKLREALALKAEGAPEAEKAFWSARLAELGEDEEERIPAPFRMPLVREAERGEIMGFFAEARDAGFSTCAVVLGDDGSGKSALASDLFRKKQAEGWRCLRERLLESDGDDHRSLEGILRDLLNGRNLSSLPLFYIRFLCSSFPDLAPEARHFSFGFSLPQRVPGLTDLNPYLLGKIFALLLESSSRQERFFLLLEDIHWGNRLVPDFLRGLFENARAPLSVLLTCRPEFRKALDIALAPCKGRLRRRDILLERLDAARTAALCRMVLPRAFSAKELEEIHRHTDGSAFLLRELLNFHHLEGACESSLKSPYEIVHRKLLSLTEEQSHLLDCLAIFPGEASFEPLRRLSGFAEDAMVDLCGQLTRRELIHDRPADAISGDAFFLSFRHPLLKKRIREAMPRLKRWNLSRRLLADLEKHPESGVDGGRLPLLARRAGDPLAELNARIRELKAHFEFSHELFPRLSDAELSATARLNDTSLTREYLEDARGLLDKLVRSRGRTSELTRHERTILTLEGGFLRWNGRYADAANCLDEAMSLALHVLDRREAVIEVLEQFCYIGIQKDAPEILRRYVFAFYREVQRAQLHPQIGMALRFLSILGLMEGRFADAAKMARMSLRLFEKLEAHGNGHTLSVVAAIHSQGDLALYMGKHEEALAHYTQCIHLCESKGFYRGLGLHLSKASWCFARLGRWKEARDCLNFARPLFEGFRSRRGASLCGGEIVFGLGALFDLRDGKEAEALENLRYAEELSSIMQKPLWNAILFCLKSVLKREAAGLFGTALPQSPEGCEAEALRLFKRLGMPDEATACQQLWSLRSQEAESGELRQENTMTAPTGR